jgi:hypothetical protein
MRFEQEGMPRAACDREQHVEKSDDDHDRWIEGAVAIEATHVAKSPAARARTTPTTTP